MKVYFCFVSVHKHEMKLELAAADKTGSGNVGELEIFLDGLSLNMERFPRRAGPANGPAVPTNTPSSSPQQPQ